MKKLLPTWIGLLAVLVAAPGHAARVNFPDLPLQTGAAYPPPNIMFILDDSGSMAYVAMPNDRSSLSTNITDKSYVNNTIYYNPYTDYKPWIKADNTRYTDGVSYYSAFTDDSILPSSCGWSGCTDLSSSTQTYFVPHDTTNYDASDAGDFDRYDIKKVSGTMHVYKTGVTSNVTSDPFDLAKGNWNYLSITVPSGTDSLSVSISGGTGNGNADLYVRKTSQPTTGSYTQRSNGNSNSESLTVTSPSAGTWWIGVYNSANGNNKTVFGETITYAMASTTEATPTGRSVADELTNFATWYSYYRTRMKVAKASASEAFAQMPSSIRVGFDTINRNTSGLPYKINVSNGGLFTDASGVTNRTDWFAKLQAANASGGTPLHRALRRAGDYFSDATSSDSPWRPRTDEAPISCRQNFAILTTDGYWNSVTGTDSSGNITGADAVGNQDGTNGTPILMSNGEYYTYDASAAANRKFADTRSSTLADVAMKYWKNDLVSTLADNVPVSDADDAFWQHMVTFGLSIGLRGNADLDLVSIANGSESWPNPLDNEDIDRIDDLWHASVDGHGSFVAATNPTEFVQGLIDALATVAARTGSASNVTANSTSFQSDTRVYQASYVSGKWIGELSAFDASAAGVATTAAWKASTSIPAVADRTILTWSASLGKGAAFPIDDSVLARSTGLAQVTGSDNAAYIKGNQTKEKQNGGLLRDRVNTVLGDIVDSSPMYVKEIDSIFVGANDGMLHAIDAGDGKELFGYIPNGTDKADLASLSDPQYVHRWFMDGPIVVSTQSQTPGHNYLVGSMGRGGSGIFGLDVTSPDSFDGNDVLWDKTWDEDVSSAPTGYADMGHVLGEPVVVKLNNGETGVIVGNGLGSSTGTASLFVIGITDGSVIAEIDTGVTSGNGLSAPRGWDTNGDGTVDYVYAGDMKGNLWKFDLNSTSPTSWKVANSGQPMFVAKDPSGATQPITSGLALAQDPDTGNRWIFFGTGQFIFTDDSTDMSVQTMYGIIDSGVVKGRTSGTDDGDLKKRTITQVANNDQLRGFETHDTLGSYKGWYIDLVQPPDDSELGERVVNRPLIRGSVLIFSSLIPPTSNTCDAGGKGYINALDAFTGTSLQQPYFDVNKNGDFNDDTIGSGTAQVPIGSVDLGIGMPTLPTIIDHLLVVGGSSGSMGQSSVNPQGGGARRISWREILRD